MILYLYGHGRVAAIIRDRQHITIKGNEVWSYFAHCASFCFVLAIGVVKAPLMYDLTAAYRGTLDKTIFTAALSSVVHLFIWIVIWLGLTAKRRWQFKLPPLHDAMYHDPAACQPLLSSSSASPPLSNHHHGILSQRPEFARTGSEESSGSGGETIYWPKINPNSPKLRVTFNEVPNKCLPHTDAKR